MKSEETNDLLRNALREWQVNTPLPPRFQEQVWQRIDRAKTGDRPTVWKLLSEWLSTTMLRRAAVAGYIAVLLATGLAGHWQGHQKKERLESQLSQQYVQSVDPYQMPRH